MIYRKMIKLNNFVLHENKSIVVSSAPTDPPLAYLFLNDTAENQSLLQKSIIIFIY